MRIRIAGFACAVLMLPAGAAANSITFEIWPSPDPGQVISCVVRWQHGQISALEVMGPGMPPRHPARWYQGQREQDALMDALTALVNGDLPTINPTGSRLPPPPFVTATWMARVDGGLMTGLFVQQGLDLPAVFDRLITTLLPGGMCDGVITG
jgi:hypothetical protein